MESKIDIHRSIDRANQSWLRFEFVVQCPLNYFNWPARIAVTNSFIQTTHSVLSLAMVYHNIISPFISLVNQSINVSNKNNNLISVCPRQTNKFLSITWISFHFPSSNFRDSDHQHRVHRSIIALTWTAAPGDSCRTCNWRSTCRCHGHCRWWWRTGRN